MRIRRARGPEIIPKVFILYSEYDRDIAHRIEKQLRESLVYVWPTKDSVANSIEENISAGDYIVILLSLSSARSKEFYEQLNAILSNDWSSRDITILPIMMTDWYRSPFPTPYPQIEFQADLSRDINRAAKKISLARQIDFSKLNERIFSELIAELLTKLSFKLIKPEIRHQEELADFTARYSYTNQFGEKSTAVWLIELKLYQNSRVSLQTINLLANRLSKYSRSFKGLLITNSQLTSVAQEWLVKANNERQVEIRVIEGTELKRLLLQHTDLIIKYFVKSTRHQDEPS